MKAGFAFLILLLFQMGKRDSVRPRTRLDADFFLDGLFGVNETELAT
jgi:hypothetical protein